MPKKIPLCAYCGINLGTTKDHVISKALFQKPLPLNMITVKACKSCNGEKALDEDYLRDFLVIDIHGSQHLVAQSLFNDKVMRAARNNNSDLAKDAIKTGKLGPWKTRNNIYLGQKPMFSINADRITKTLNFMVRGLYYKNSQGKLIPPGCTFEVRRIDPFEIKEAWNGFLSMKANGPFGLGQGVFDYQYVVSEEDAGESIWLLVFYQCVAFFVFTTRSQEN